MSDKKRSPARSPPPPPTRNSDDNGTEEFVLAFTSHSRHSSQPIAAPKIFVAPLQHARTASEDISSRNKTPADISHARTASEDRNKILTSSPSFNGQGHSGSEDGSRRKLSSSPSFKGQRRAGSDDISGGRKHLVQQSFRSQSSPAIDSELVRSSPDGTPPRDGARNSTNNRTPPRDLDVGSLPNGLPPRAVDVTACVETAARVAEIVPRIVEPVTSVPEIASSSVPRGPLLRFQDVSNQWPALITQVSNGLANCKRLAEFFQASVGEGPEDPTPPMDATQHTALQSMEAIMCEDRLEQARQRQTRLLVVEQVGKPLLRFCIEANEQLAALISEEKQLGKALETTGQVLQNQKMECLSLWEDLKQPSGDVPVPSHRRGSSLSSRGNSTTTAVAPTKKRSPEIAFKAFKQYETLLKRTNVYQHRFVRDVNRLLNSLEELERTRLHTLNVYCQLYSELKQRPISLLSPEAQIQEFLSTKFDPAERHTLRFVGLTYDLPCSAEDIREGRLQSSSDALSSLSLSISAAINGPEVCNSSPLLSSDLARPFGAFNISAFLGYPDASSLRKTVERAPLPRFDDREIGSLKRNRIGRLLLNIETDADLPKPRSEESDRDGNGFLELMLGSYKTTHTWKLVHCAARPGKLLLSAKKEGTTVKFPTRAARFIRFARSEVTSRPYCFCIYFPHSSQRLIFSCKTELAVQDWLQAFSRTAVEKGVVGRSLVLPSLALSGEKVSLQSRLDAIEKGVASIREAIAVARETPSDWLELDSDAEEEGDGHSSMQVVDSKPSELSAVVKESYLKAELHGYLDRMLLGMVEHEPYSGFGSHHTWDLMAPVPRKYWVVLKIFLSTPSTLVSMLRSVMPKHKSLDRLAKVVLNIAAYTGTTVEILDALVTEEVARTPFETQLFRTDSVASKMWGFFSVPEGKSYLAKMLAKPVQACILDASASDAPAIDFELDSTKISHVKSVHEHLKNKEQSEIIVPKHQHSHSFGGSSGSGNSSNNNTPTVSGPKAMSWWAKKLHSSNDEKSDEPLCPPTPGSRRVSVGTSTVATTGTASTSAATPSSSHPPASPSLFRRISVSKTKNNSDEKEDNTASFPLDDSISRRASSSELPVVLTTRYATLEAAYFSRVRQNDPPSEKKVGPPGLPRSDSGGLGGLPVKFEKPKALTPAVAREDPTEFVRQAKVAQNLAHLEQCCIYFLNEIVRSLDYCPRNLRLIAHSVHRAVGQTFPSARLAAVGSFFFLRFLCPQMLQVAWAPEVNSNMTTNARRNLLLLTKVLQFLANCASDDAMTREQVHAGLAAKEASMMALVDFVHAQAPRVSQFLHHLADPSDPRFLKSLIEPSAQVLEDQARDIDLDLEWFVTHVLSSVVNSDE